MPTGHANRLLPSLRRVVLVRHHADLSDGQLLTAFVGEQDADAFAALVKRHGAMVFGVCRRIVGDVHTAEDAFQAVFLVLARRAAAVRPREAVGNWLYGVAFRTAIKARSVLARRRSREKQVDAMPEPHAPAPADVWSDLQPVIDEELARLPDKFRLPVVLCDLEGRPQRDVARQLKLPPATLATRLASARRTLAARLTKRGITLSGGALAGVLCSHASAQAVSRRLADGAVRAAEAVAAGSLAGVGQVVSAQAFQLSEGVMRMMLVTKLKAVGVAVVAALGLTTGLGLGVAPAFADDTPAKPAAKPAGESDAAYLDRLCQDVRGTTATGVEKGYFTADRDAGKRRKVLDWLMADETVRAYLAKKHGADETRTAEFALLVDSLAFSPDGQKIAVSGMFLDVSPSILVDRTGANQTGVAGAIVLNERNYNLHRTKLKAQATAGDDVVAPSTFSFDHLKTAADTWFFRLAQAQPPQGNWEVELYSPQEVQPFVTRPAQFEVRDRVWVKTAPESDADFLKRVVKDARGTDPTALEAKYFADDKDPKKREKLLDALLKEPGVAKKLGDGWKKKMLEQGTTVAQVLPTYEYRVVTKPQIQNYRYSVTLSAPQPDRLDKLLGELIDAKKTDAQILDALTLAIVGRQPADGEKLAVAAVAKAADRKAAWAEVVKALAATDEAKKYAADLTKRNPPEKK